MNTFFSVFKYVLMAGAGLVLAFFVLFAGYGWREGHDVLSGMTHLFEGDPGPVQNNPQVADVAWQRINWLGDIENRQLNESSGLAASPLHEGVLWSLNDSGNAPHIYALDTEGRDLGVWPVDVDQAIDWESMDAFVWNDTAYLIIGDTGDNFRWRRSLRLLVVEEPKELTPTDTPLPLAWEIVYRYPDGYRDSEALAVDADLGWVYVLSKRHYPPELFRLPLRPASTDTQVAEFLGELIHLPRSTALDYAEDDNARYRYTPGGMDLASDRLLLTTYRHGFMYQLSDLTQPPLRIKLPSIGQREALTFAHGSSRRAFVTRERSKGRGAADLFQIEFKTSAEKSSAAAYESTSGLSSGQTPGEETLNGE